ncbi:putative Xre family DNA-binding protein [Oscillibacter valericigenes Sjm18-20]|nr:putative Xre family DNA-binding protein [Oscillibacter valericigenes Sjm18-20]
MDQKIKQDQCIGTNLQRLRTATGLTQEQMAAKMQLYGIDMSRDFYAHIENGSYNVRTSELVAFQKILKCSFDDFFKGLN